MSHQVSPTGFRVGKTFLWSSNKVFLKNNNQILSNQLSVNSGIESIINQFIYKKKYRVVKVISNNNTYSKFIGISILYYQMFNSISRKKIFPLYFMYRNMLAKSANYSVNFKTLFSNL